MQKIAGNRGLTRILHGRRGMARAKAQPQRAPEPWFMTDYYSLPELPYGLPELPYGMTDDRPSGLRVLAKSLHLLAFGWLATVAWLWVVQVQLNVERFGGGAGGLRGADNRRRRHPGASR